MAEAQGVTFDTKDGLPSTGWYFRFLERHLNLTERTIQHTESSRLKAQDPNIICVFFKELEEFVATTFPNGIPSGRVGRLDEFRDFNSYSPKKTKGVAPKGAQQVRSPFFLDRSWVTVVGWGMADGVCGPPTFVLPNLVSWLGALSSQQAGGGSTRWGRAVCGLQSPLKGICRTWKSDCTMCTCMIRYL